MAALLCSVGWILLELLTVEYFGQFNHTIHAKLPIQVLERSMDLHTCAMALIYVSWTGCVSSSGLFEKCKVLESTEIWKNNK